MDILITRLDAGVPLPSYAHPGDAGADLVTTVDVRIGPGERVLVPTGIAMALPEGYVGLVHPRSGLAARHGLTVLNSPGTIDADYRGEIRVLLANLGSAAVTITRGMRVAQMVIAPVVRADIVEVASLDNTKRGSGGFGSTGS